MARILVVEDDAPIRQLLRRACLERRFEKFPEINVGKAG